MHIICAAVRFKRLIVSRPAPARHHDILHALPEDMVRTVRPSDQGFIASDGFFYGRHAAWLIARAAGQVKGDTGPELFTEDIWESNGATVHVDKDAAD